MSGLSISAAAAAVLGCLAAAAAGDASIRVDPGRILGRVPPGLLGHNVEAADAKDIFGSQHRYMGRTGQGLWDPRARKPAPRPLALARDVGCAVMRYPGGCLTHNFVWTDAIGPPEDRPDFAFGVVEFVRWCRAAGAEPLMNVSAYRADANAAAALVEFCNAPADADHPWARRRAAGGHPEPLNIRHWEMGNESDHGNHDVKPFRKHTPQSYAEWFNACARRMRAVDPGIRIGPHMGTGTPPECLWNRVVLDATADSADFVVIHTYAVGLWDPKGAKEVAEDTGLLMRACMAAGEQTADLVARYREVIDRHAGKPLPIAVTEYNASFVQQEPIPYRFTLGAALFSADYVRVLMDPKLKVTMANYWHFANGYWGMIRGPEQPGDRRPWRRMPAFWLYRLWGRHFGRRLVAARAEGPRLEFEGCLRVRPARAGSGDAGELPLTLAEGGGEGGTWRWRPTGKRSFRVTLTDHATDVYPTLGRVACRPGRTYRLVHEGRTVGGTTAGTVGVDMIDARGWHETHSGSATAGVEGAREWQEFATKLVTLPGCDGLELHLRLLASKAAQSVARAGERTAGGAVSGTYEIRNLRVERLADCPPYAALTAAGSLSDDGRTLYVIVFNKHHADPIAAHVRVADGSAASAKAWCVTGPSLSSLNLDAETVHQTVSGADVAGVNGGGFAWTFPPHSMTAFEIARDAGGP